VVDDIKVVEFGVEFHDSMKLWVYETRLCRSDKNPTFRLRKDIAWNFILIHMVLSFERSIHNMLCLYEVAGRHACTISSLTQ
jgi:hypothetical protein